MGLKVIGVKGDAKIMARSLACTSPFIVFWMTYAESCNFPMGTHIESVECIVILKGFKMSFDTHTPVTSSANNTQGVFAQMGIGLNRHLLLRNFDSHTKPMNITKLTISDAKQISDRLWGYSKFDNTNFDKSIPKCVGITSSLKMYCAFLKRVLYNKATDHRNIGNHHCLVIMLDMMMLVRTFNFLDHFETPCVHYVKTNVLQPKCMQLSLPML